MKKTVTALLLAALAGPASAGYFTGDEIVSICKTGGPRDTESVIDRVACRGFVAGVIYGGHYFSNLVCLPNGLSIGQMADVVVKYVERNPQLRHMSDAELIHAAVVMAGWGCK